jgi:hypothetical protein
MYKIIRKIPITLSHAIANKTGIQPAHLLGCEF